ncbi:ABC transporter substrate-binding protein [Paenisporosarcina antarctica]|uniref:Glycine/betaine ABC transporter substrate-binding protein n=1 Tax=Paenisporosarcina antarctica TaxID=417367 RepID=A0A4P6ZV56_9BACL|nr:glycine betaine ABC transporter substrate-binding protein [Paenisporosarcina antarctica]QBP40221.1 glycine/betaine ABC transporter substrate-binding protein [Paenisporosarcina antarctica]
MKSRKILSLFSFILIISIFVTGCGGADSSSKTSEDGKPTISVGSKNFTEQFILGEIYSQALEAEGYPVERKLNLGGTLVAFEALKSGDIDLYPEYTGTALMDILDGEPSGDGDAVYQEVKDGLAKDNIEVLDKTNFNNTYVVVATKEIAEKHNLKTLSDLAVKAPELNFALIPEFSERADGLPGLQKTYGGFEFKNTQLFEIGLKYRALTSGEVDVTIGFGTDGQIAGFDLVALEDDKNFWPPYHAVPLVRKSIVEENPEIAEILNKINGLLDDKKMASLNWKADGEDKEEPSDIAKEFLEENGFFE